MARPSLEGKALLRELGKAIPYGIYDVSANTG